MSVVIQLSNSYDFDVFRSQISASIAGEEIRSIQLITTNGCLIRLPTIFVYKLASISKWSQFGVIRMNRG